VPDPHFAVRRLAAIYDALDPDRGDLDAYASIVADLGARRVLDIGCGTGTFACLLAARGLDVVGVDPAVESLRVARGKPYADRVRWVCGEAGALRSVGADVATMTGNVAQVFLSDEQWDATLRAVRDSLRPGGWLVFETRDPARQGWLEWNRAATFTRVDVPGAGVVESWLDVTDVRPGVVSFRGTYVFASDGAVLTSDSTLRFRDRAEVAKSLARTGFVVDEVRDAPDRPGREFVFVARRDAIEQVAGPA
jgi:SAM-dependent methyltransferase